MIKQSLAGVYNVTAQKIICVGDYFLPPTILSLLYQTKPNPRMEFKKT